MLIDTLPRARGETDRPFRFGKINQIHSRLFSFYEDKELFSRLWMLGVTIPKIMAVIGIKSPLTITAWRKRLGLPKRRQGCHRQEKQVTYPKTQDKERNEESS